MTTPLVTVPQVLKFAGMYTEVPRDRMNGIGFGLGAIVAEYLCQSEPKRLSLKTVRQVLSLPPLESDVWMVVDWRETPPRVKSGFAVISGPTKHHRSFLTQLRPTDVGLSNDAHPADVIDLATSWGYSVVPRVVLETLIQNPPPSRGQYLGQAVVPLGNAQFAYLDTFATGHARRIDQMDVTAPNFATTWSVIMAY